MIVDGSTRLISSIASLGYRIEGLRDRSRHK